MDDKKELKDQRIPIMMSASEVEAIDEWSFSNRIRSRGEAIRRLCQMALVLDAKLTPIADAINQFAPEYAETIQLLSNSLMNQDTSKKKLEDISHHLLMSSIKFKKMKWTIRELTGRAYDFKSDIPFDEAKNSSSDHKEFFDDILSQMSEVIKEFDNLKDKMNEIDKKT